MKLLFDENLSPKLVAALADKFPDSCHVDRVGLGGADDNQVWEYAHQHDFALVSKDSDFHEKSLLHGYPPKVIWIKRGNCTNKQIEIILRNRAEQIETLLNDPEAAFLILL
jgi:predicted nuclease of predicted toxin-antitoxin system